MAIKYLSNISLEEGELQNFRVQNLGSDPSGYGGRLIYRSDTGDLKYYDDSGAGVWRTLSITTGTVTSVGLSMPAAFSVTGSPVTSSGTLTVTGAGTNAQVVLGDGSLGTYNTGTMSSWTLTGDSGSQTITDGDTVDIAGGTKISTAASATDTLTINHDNTTRTDTTSTDTLGSGGSFTKVDSVTTDATGHITAINLETVTIGSFDNYGSWTLAGDTGSQTITSGNTVTISGSTGIDTVASATDTLTVNLDLSELTTVTTIDPAADFLVGVDGTANEKILYQNVHLDQWGDAEADVDFGGNKLLDVATGTAGTDGVNLAQVQALVSGVGVFQGGYNANTNSPALTGASNIALNQGDFFVVTTGGNFFTERLEVGDLVFANSAIAANSSPSLSDYTVVIADQNIAGVGTNDANTEKGVAGFNSANFTATANGFIELANSGVTANPYGGASKSLSATVTDKGLLTSLTEQDIAITSSQVTDFCTAVETCVGSNITFADTIGDNTNTTITVNHNLGTRDVIVQLYDISGATPTYATIRADVRRNGVNSVQVITNTAITTNGARIIITKVA